jgi:hypothetical protein
MSEGTTNDPERAPLAKPSVSKQSTREEAQRFLQSEILKLQAEKEGLEADKLALMQEYVTATDEEAPEKVKKNIRARMPAALSAIDELLATGNDGVRAGLAKWIVDRGLAPDSLGGTDSTTKELNKLLSQLQE